MRSPEYRAAFKAVDDAGGIYDFRWGDAPMRTLIVLSLLPLHEIHHFRLVGYKHVLEVGDDYLDVLPPRSIHPGYPESADDVIIQISIETGTPLPPDLAAARDSPHTAAVSIPTASSTPVVVKKTVKSRMSSTPSPLPPIASSPLGLPPSSTAVPTGRVRGAIVYLVRGEFDKFEMVDRAIQTLDDAFNRRLQYPIVVFTGVIFDEPRDRLPKQEWLDWLANRTTTRLIFAEVNFTDYINAPFSSSAGSVEGYGRDFFDKSRFFAGMIMDHPAMQVCSDCVSKMYL